MARVQRDAKLPMRGLPFEARNSCTEDRKCVSRSSSDNPLVCIPFSPYSRFLAIPTGNAFRYRIDPSLEYLDILLGVC